MSSGTRPTLLVLVPFVRGRARIPKAMGFESYLDLCEELHSAGLDGLRENQPYTGRLGGCYDEWLEAWQELSRHCTSCSSMTWS